ncbi:SRPBCC domain-containing protein [uncultured Arthrobacter sp.]|uniref:SRPBCC family protein n=1 Tax=uncultured Arthrobacter sp. TaxID=114050 RepID=UPI002608EEB9|nr:SRPBCC domain-containing protein [uncultured Arthrobacter sp.]
MSNQITVTRTFAAPRERVFAAWTDPKDFSVWFGSSQVNVPLDSLVLDVRPGGNWSAVMELPDGGTINWEGRYTEVTPPERLALTITDQPGTDPGAPITVTFTELEGSTQMTLVQEALDFSEDQREQTAVGYQSFFDDMEALVAS